MKRFYFCTIFLAFFVVTGSGCSMKSEHKPQINAAVLECPEGTPPDEQCVVEYRGAAHLMGGGRNSALFVKGGLCMERDAQGNMRSVPCGTVTLGAWNVPDRVDTLAPAFIGATGDVLSARQIRLGQEYSSKKQVEAAEKAGPGLVIINDNKASGGGGGMSVSVSESGAIAQQTSSVGVGVDTGCGSGNCYDPTQ